MVPTDDDCKARAGNSGNDRKGGEGAPGDKEKAFKRKTELAGGEGGGKESAGIVKRAEEKERERQRKRGSILYNVARQFAFALTLEAFEKRSA